MKTNRSQALYEQAVALMPGGVSSPVRAFRAVGGTPRFIARGEGAHVIDVDGNRYLDFVGSWGPLILGHAPEVVVEAVTRAARNGMSFGAPCEGEVQLAQLLTRAYPAVQRVRFVSSGTEAVMSAVRVARGYTGRSIIVKFDGCYHGHADHLLVAGGSGLATFGQPSSAGVPVDMVKDTVVAPLGDRQALEQLFNDQGDQIAAVIIEPIPANAGLLVQRAAFHEDLRALTRRYGALLIFDEVISGFRVHPGGAAALLGITPDMATFGKVIGGGMPVGAYGGSAEIMKVVAPDGPVYQAGTLSGNPVAMAAGKAVLEALSPDLYARLETLGQRLEAGVRGLIQRRGAPAQFVRVGSIFWICMQPPPAPVAFADVDPAGAARYKRFFATCLEHGVYLAPSAYEVGFLSAAHTEAHVDRALEVFDEAFAAVTAG